MKPESVKKVSYLASLLIMAAALVPSNLPFLSYIRRLARQGDSASLQTFYAKNDISALPLSLGGRFFYTFFPFILLLAVLFLLWRILHGKKPLSLISGSESFRWKLFRHGFLLWLALSFGADFIQFMLHRENYSFSFEPAAWFRLLFLGILFIVPQVMLEEAFFRGYLIKGGTLFTGTPVIPLILCSVIFGLLHNANPEVSRYGALVMMPQYIGMGLFLSYLCWISDGLEISLGIHLANNAWGLLVVNSGGTAFKTPSPFTMESWDPLSSLIYLGAAMALFLIISRPEKNIIVRNEKRYYYDN